MLRKTRLLAFLLVAGVALTACQFTPQATISTSVPTGASPLALLPAATNTRAAETQTQPVATVTPEHVAIPTVPATLISTKTFTPTHTPEPTATQTPTATAETPMATIKTSGTNIRLGPGTGYGIAEKEMAGQRLDVIGQVSKADEIWWQVKTKDGRVGYVREDLVDENAAVAGVPVVEKQDLPPTPTAAPIKQVINQPKNNAIVITADRINVYSEEGAERGYILQGKVAYLRILGTTGSYYQAVIVKPDGSEGAQVLVLKSDQNVSYRVSATLEKSQVVAGTVGGRTELRRIGAYLDGNDVVVANGLGYWAQEGSMNIPKWNEFKWFICGDIRSIDYASGLVTVLIQYDGQERTLQANISGAGYSLRVDILNRVGASMRDFTVDDNVSLYFAGKEEMQNWASGNGGVGRVTGVEGTR